MHHSHLLRKTKRLEDRIKIYFPDFEKKGYLSAVDENIGSRHWLYLIIHDDEGYHRGSVSFNNDFTPDMIFSQTGHPLGFYLIYPEADFIMSLEGEKLDSREGINFIFRKTKQIAKPEYEIGQF